MSSVAEKVARFGILTSLALVLGFLDRAIPVSSILGGAVPGVKLGLANTVLLYAVYLMDWKNSILLMLTKVLLSGFLFGSLNAMLYSLAGGVLSLAVMLAVRKKPSQGVFSVFILCAASIGWVLLKNQRPSGQVLWGMILIASACVCSLAIFLYIQRKTDAEVIGTSISGAVAHNVGQVMMASWMLQTPQLILMYLPFLIGIGATVGCLTGIIAHRTLQVLR